MREPEEMHNRSDRTLQQVALLAGPVMVVVWLAGVFVSTLIFPSFNWTSNTLAEVGRAGAPSALLFDASFVLGVVLAGVFLGRIWPETAHTLQRVGIGLVGFLLVITAVAQLGVQNPWLELIALAFLLLLLPALGLYGTGDILAGHPGRGILAFWLGIAHILSWQILSIILEFSSAIPTYTSLVLISIWVLSLYGTVRRSGR